MATEPSPDPARRGRNLSETLLQDVAAAADELADDQRTIARKARTMQRQRDRGWSWARILEHQRSPELVDLMRRSRQLMLSTTSLLVRGVADGLSSEGESHRQIAGRLSVTHQRVTSLLRWGDARSAGH